MYSSVYSVCEKNHATLGPWPFLGAERVVPLRVNSRRHQKGRKGEREEGHKRKTRTERSRRINKTEKGSRQLDHKIQKNRSLHRYLTEGQSDRLGGGRGGEGYIRSFIYKRREVG